MRIATIRTLLAVIGLAMSCVDAEPEAIEAGRGREEARELLEQIAATDATVFDLPVPIRSLVDQDRT